MVLREGFSGDSLKFGLGADDFGFVHLLSTGVLSGASHVQGAQLPERELQGRESDCLRCLRKEREDCVRRK